MPTDETAATFAFADLFAGIGGFHATLTHAGGECVFASEIDDDARATYRRNWLDTPAAAGHPQLNTDIRLVTPEEGPVTVPDHDVLAAGFPCQPFSKSGLQNGMEEARGTLFWNIARVLETKKPAVVLLENVRNLAGPRHRHEWDVIIRTLRDIGYRVSSEPTIFSPHLLPATLGGTPQVRERVFILGTFVGPEVVAREVETGQSPAPVVPRAAVQDWDPKQWDVRAILDADADIANLEAYSLTAQEVEWIATWDAFVSSFRGATGHRLPGFPLWADYWSSDVVDSPLMAELPDWKQELVRKNVDFYETHRALINTWRAGHPRFESFPASRKKLEWQARELTSLWDTVLQLRPSGIRAKEPTYLPALVAINQTSVYGPRRRRITPREAARLQGLPERFSFGDQRDAISYKQVGNGVAVGAAWYVFRAHVEQNAHDLPARLVEAVLAAPISPLA